MAAAAISAASEAVVVNLLNMAPLDELNDLFVEAMAGEVQSSWSHVFQIRETHRNRRGFRAFGGAP
jgi:hypothetical protein